jgi:hypothetical protein
MSTKLKFLVEFKKFSELIEEKNKDKLYNYTCNTNIDDLNDD